MAGTSAMIDDIIYSRYRDLALMIVTVALQDYKTDYRQYLRGRIKKPNRDLLLNNEWLNELIDLCDFPIKMEVMLDTVERRIENEEAERED